MNRLIFLLIVFPVFLSSCRKDPQASFLMDKSNAFVGETINFTNRSMDAHDITWDFGDGYTSSNFNVAHAYSEPGIYNVILTVYGKSGNRDVATGTVQILEEYATLEVEVVLYTDDNTGYVLPDASVRLYPSLDDWENETNMVVEGFTNNNGKVTFTDLIAQRRYYVDVWEENHDNYQLASEDAGWIETQILEPGTLNSFVAYVDYYAPSKKSSGARKGKRPVGSSVGEEGQSLRIRSGSLSPLHP